jgi:hypothetical protein
MVAKVLRQWLMGLGTKSLLRLSGKRINSSKLGLRLSGLELGIRLLPYCTK